MPDSFPRRLTGLVLVAIGAIALWWLIFGWPEKELAPPPPLTPPVGMTMSQVDFADLPGWQADGQGAALAAFQTSCTRRLTLPADRAVEPVMVGGTVADWEPVCTAALAMDVTDDKGARDFFESAFTPLAVEVDGKAEGLFTGYYEPLIDASRTPDDRFHVPLYQRPPELVTVDLGEFREDLKGRRIAGSVVGGRLRPFASRAEIEAGALSGRDLELLWADDPVDVFFLQIQGSGRVRLPDGNILSVGYDGPNGRDYTSLGRLMVARNILHPDHVSSPIIADWLRNNPVAGAGLMAENASYIFFRFLDGDGPLGAEGVVLTPGRSLAVDRAHLPLGAPIWLETTHPDPNASPGPDAPQIPFQRLMVAQDTGGAIKGAVRGDVFWGFGEEAEIIAGRMANRGRFWLLLPEKLAARLLASSSRPDS